MNVNAANNPWLVHRGLLAREAAVAGMINVLLAGTITWLRFGGSATVPIWGVSGLVADGVPSTLLPVLLMSVAITLIVRRRRRLAEGAKAPQILYRSRLGRLPQSATARALVLATLALAVVLPVTALASSVYGAQYISLAAAMAVKLIQACLLGVVLGPVVVVSALCDSAAHRVGRSHEKP